MTLSVLPLFVESENPYFLRIFLLVDLIHYWGYLENAGRLSEFAAEGEDQRVPSPLVELDIENTLQLFEAASEVDEQSIPIHPERASQFYPMRKRY